MKEKFEKLPPEKQKVICQASSDITKAVAGFIKKGKEQGKIKTVDDVITLLDGLAVAFSEPKLVKLVFKQAKLESDFDKVFEEMEKVSE